MDMKKFSRLPVEFTVNEIFDADDTRFLAITIDVLHEGLNFNNSIFEREVVDANADSIKNTPVLGYIAVNPEGMKDYQGHEYKEIETVDVPVEQYIGEISLLNAIENVKTSI